jgi:hypothetical protein
MILRRRSLSLSGDNTDADDDRFDAVDDGDKCFSWRRVAGEERCMTSSVGREDDGLCVLGGGVDEGSLAPANTSADSRARIASIADA